MIEVKLAKKQSQNKVAVSYIRTSTASQTRKDKIYRCNIFIQEEAKRLDAKVIEHYQDIGVLDCPEEQVELQKMMKYLSEHKVDYVIVPSIAMLTRNQSILTKYIEEAIKSGAAFVFPEYETDTLFCIQAISQEAKKKPKVKIINNAYHKPKKKARINAHRVVSV